jgi:hypothetical protein
VVVLGVKDFRDNLETVPILVMVERVETVVQVELQVLQVILI